MKQFNINNPDGGGFYTISKVEDFEYVNPVDQICKTFIALHTKFDRNFLLAKGFVPTQRIEALMQEKAVKEWQEEYKKMTAVKVPDALVVSLTATTKKEQVKALKGLAITSEELMAFIIVAWEEYGFSFSQYRSSYHHAGLDETKLPELIHKEDDGSIKSIGETPMTEGELKQVIEARSVKVSKFLDKNGAWHCFFLTYKSLGGEETGGKPHLHYISGTWGLKREDVLAQLTSKKYRLPSLPHINFHTHRNPKEDE